MARLTYPELDYNSLAGCPRLGLGLAALGRPGYINLERDAEIGDKASRSVDAMREQVCPDLQVSPRHACYDCCADDPGILLQSFKVMDAAWESGLRYFDCARSYGKSEEFLQAWLESRKISPDEVAVGSKWGYRCDVGPFYGPRGPKSARKDARQCVARTRLSQADTARSAGSNAAGTQPIGGLTRAESHTR